MDKDKKVNCKVFLKPYKFKLIGHVKASAINSEYKKLIIEIIDSMEMSLVRYARTSDIELFSKFIGGVCARVDSKLTKLGVHDIIISRVIDVLRGCKL